MKRTRCWLWKRPTDWVGLYIGKAKPVIDKEGRVNAEKTKGCYGEDCWWDVFCAGEFKKFMPETYAKLTNKPKRFYMKFET